MEKIENWLVNYLQEQKDLGRPLKVLRAKEWRKVPKHLRDVKAVANYFGVEQELFNNLNPHGIQQGGVIVPGKALNVSYTEDGLRWTLNKYGSLLYYKDTVLTLKDAHGRLGNIPRLKGSMEQSDKVFVEDFIPRNHVIGDRMHRKNQSIEYFWCNKAQKLLYVTSE